MPDPFERRSRPNGCCEGWYSQPSRSQLRSAAVTDGVREPAKKAAARKGPSLCKAAHWKGPHTPELRKHQFGWHRDRECTWDASWRDGPRWFCEHEETCTGCGKVLRAGIPPEECPDFVPLSAGKRAAIDAEIRQRRERLAERRPVITGPQGYRKRRSA